MAARDDSVIRGSFITATVLLVFSIGLNVWFYQSGSTASATAARATERLNATQQEVQNLQSRSDLMKSMLGVGGNTEAERDELIRDMEGDPEMATILTQFKKDMSYFGQEIDPQNQNYQALPAFLVNSIRSNNDALNAARKDLQAALASAKMDVENARKAQQIAEEAATTAKNDLATAQSQFAAERDEMKKRTEETKDKLTKVTTDFRNLEASFNKAKQESESKIATLTATIDSQRQELNRLQNDRFEDFQGQITYVVRGGNLAMINLGSADSLRPGITFGVVDGDELRPEDAKVKATIQVTKIRGPHLAEARVVADPQSYDPIIPSDQIYSPFWAPGRKVKIALAGDIDLDSDGKPDNEQLASQIAAAGVEVVVVPDDPRKVPAALDNSIRFLIVGEDPELSAAGDAEMDEDKAQRLAAIGVAKGEANQRGISVLPYWKLQGFLRTIDDSLTVPLGSAVRGSDFPPEPNLNIPRGGTTTLPETYRNQIEGMQQGNRIRP